MSITFTLRKTEQSCRACGSDTYTKELYSLGEMYVSNFVKKQNPQSKKYRMDLCICEQCGLAQLIGHVPPEEMYGETYWYHSGINQTMRTALKDVVDSVTKKIDFNDNDVWIDIASNDLTLLNHVPSNLTRVGIDPYNIKFIPKNNRKNIHVIQDYFSKEVYDNYAPTAGKKAKVISCISCFYDIDKPNEFLKNVHDVLSDDGIFVLQLSYTPLMLNNLEFGNLCFEHLCYYDFRNLYNLLLNNEFGVLDCELNSVNGGSIRVVACKTYEGVKSYGTVTDHPINDMRVESLLLLENSSIFGLYDRWDEFFEEIHALKEKTVDFIKKEKARGKKVYAYGMSTKGNSLLQFYGLDNALIDKGVERSKAKVGLQTIGTGIPIISEEQMREEQPDYLLILPWFFIDEFKEREREYLNKGGKFIMPCPEFKVIND